MERNVNNIDNVIRKLILIDGTLYVKCKEKLEEDKIRVDLQKDYAAYINEGGTIHFGKDFFRRPVKEQLFILMHEMMHEILNHFIRFEKIIKIKREGKIIDLRYLINIATDLAINSVLNEMTKENKIKTLVETPKDALLPSKFNFPEGRSAEFYLTQLLKLKNLDKILNNNKNFDKHEGDYNNEEDENGNMKGKSGNEDKDGNEEIIEVYNENIDEVIDKIENIIKNSNTNTTNKNWSEGEGLIKRIIERIVGKSMINWKKILENKIINFVDYSNKYIRVIDKKNLSRNVYYHGLPTIVPEKLKRKEEFRFNVNVFIDTSGSVGEKELQEFIFQVFKIIENVENIDNLNIYLFSDKIYYQDTIKIKNNNKEEVKEKIREIARKIQSGGTSFKEIKEIYDKEKKGVFITFTDGYAEEININKNLNKLFIWIIVNNREFQDKNKNTVIHIEV